MIYMYTSSILLSYIDPVSGVILLQLFIGGSIGFIASFRHKIWRFGVRLFSKPLAEAGAAESLALPSTLQSRGPIEPGEEMAAIEDPVALNQSRNQREQRKAA
jgi:hypothetical protein